jgi:ABC-type uncharacterized transport system substrate-binding protein
MKLFASFLTLLLFSILSSFCHAAPPIQTTANPSTLVSSSPLQPVLHETGRKWRFGYVDSGDYSEYPHTLRGIIHGLMQLGWLTVPELPPSLDSSELWTFLAKHARSDYIEFVSDAWWQPGYADATQRPKLRDEIRHRIATRGDIDLIIAMGTWAGQDMAQLGAPVPTVVASASDPVRSNITFSETDSGLDNLHARMDPERYKRQVELFHDIVPFKRLGVVYEDSADGRVYGGLSAIQDVANQAGFTIQHCHADFNGSSQREASAHLIDCYQQLAPHIDAAYVTVHRGVTTESLQEIIEILRNANIPSFSMLGSKEVQQGVLLGLTPADANYLGAFYAETIARILHGESPRKLNQIWVEPAKLAINLDTAREIGFDPPVEALLAADEIFSK